MNVSKIGNAHVWHVWHITCNVLHSLFRCSNTYNKWVFLTHEGIRVLVCEHMKGSLVLVFLSRFCDCVVGGEVLCEPPQELFKPLESMSLARLRIGRR